MGERRALLVVLAHPDDENGMGGTLARYAAEGARVVLVTATRGEAGTIFNPALATPETIAQVREQELRCSCDALGIEPPRFLDCGDGAVQDCSDAALEPIVRLIRELRPQVMITFGPDGIYGHPDHVAVHRLATLAWQRAGQSDLFPQHGREGLGPYQPARLLYFALTRSFIDVWRRYADLSVELNGQRLQIVGVPDDEITLALDVTPYVEQKIVAFGCHRTQMNPDSPRNAAPAEEMEKLNRTENFVLAGGAPYGAGSQADLFAGLP